MSDWNHRHAAGTEKLSPQAQRLVELVYDEKQSLKEVLKSNPDLMDGVDEYAEWVGDNEAAIAEKRETPVAGHGIKNATKRLKEKKK